MRPAHVPPCAVLPCTPGRHVCLCCCTAGSKPDGLEGLGGDVACRGAEDGTRPVTRPAPGQMQAAAHPGPPTQQCCVGGCASAGCSSECCAAPSRSAATVLLLPALATTIAAAAAAAATARPHPAAGQVCQPIWCAGGRSWVEGGQLREDSDGGGGGACTSFGPRRGGAGLGLRQQLAVAVPHPLGLGVTFNTLVSPGVGACRWPADLTPCVSYN